MTWVCSDQRPTISFPFPQRGILTRCRAQGACSSPVIMFRTLITSFQLNGKLHHIFTSSDNIKVPGQKQIMYPLTKKVKKSYKKILLQKCNFIKLNAAHVVPCASQAFVFVMLKVETQKYVILKYREADALFPNDLEVFLAVINGSCSAMS